VRGVDGIKTGYTRAAGFNLVTSAQLDGRSIVGVVLGGTSTPQRDTKMRRLVEAYLPLASRRGDSDAFVSMQSKKTVETAYAEQATTTSADAAMQVASASSDLDLPHKGPMPETRYSDDNQASSEDQGDTEQVADADPQNLVPVVRKKTIRLSGQKVAQLEVPVPAENLTRSVAVVEPKAERKAEQKVDQLTTASTSSDTDRKGWVIQVGAAPGKDEAMGLLQKAQDKGGKVLRAATPFTIAYNEMYRARFSGFRNQDAAVNACKALKRKGVSCWASLQ
jgi:D-alanyl-D-alanine carboxypeptidase